MNEGGREFETNKKKKKVEPGRRGKGGSERKSARLLSITLSGREAQWAKRELDWMV